MRGVIAGVLLAIAVLGDLRQAAAPGVTRVTRADLDVLVEQIVTRHPNPFHHISRRTFEARVAALRAEIDDLPPTEALVAVTRLAASIGDGHTRIGLPAASGVLPIDVEWLDDGWRVVRADAAHAILVGTTIEAIGGHPVEEVAAEVRTLEAQEESPGFVLGSVARLLVNADILEGIGVLDQTRRAAVVLSSADGRRVRVELDAVPAAARTQWPQPPHTALSGSDALRSISIATVRWADSNVGYVRWNNYMLAGPRSIFGDAVHAAFSEADRLGVTRLVIDLRWNAGGDFTRGREYVLSELRARPRFLRPRSLYALIGRRTFSAAMVNAIDLKQQAGAVLVGEPTGQRPNGYSEAGFFTLPASGLQGTVSICRYDLWPRDEPGVPPDQLIPPHWHDVLEGRDSAMEWIVAEPPPDPAAAPFRPTVKVTPPCRRR